MLRIIKEWYIEDAIKLLNTYVKESHPAELIQQVENVLKKYKEKYEIMKMEREVEKETGIRIESVKIWLERDLWYYRPIFWIKVKNISCQECKEKPSEKGGIRG